VGVGGLEGVTALSQEEGGLPSLVPLE